MATYKEHSKAQDHMKQYNRTHNKMFHQAIIKTSDGFAIIRYVNALIFEVDCEYDECLETTK